MWCVDDGCKGNPFWASEDVMWFCLRCKVWYHPECCKTMPSVRVYDTLGDILLAPLLRGGSFGRYGTAPCIRSASDLIWKMVAEEGQSYDKALCTPVPHKGFRQAGKFWLEHQRKLLTDFECPQCGFWSHQSSSSVYT